MNTPVRIECHRAGAPGLRLLRLDQVKQLLDQHSFWAQGREREQLKRMLASSQAVVTAWQGRQLVGIGRATSDGAYRAVLWDVVVSSEHQGQGIGRSIVEGLLASPAVAGVERVYLMTTNSSGFYRQLGFNRADSQELLLWQPVSDCESG